MEQEEGTVLSDRRSGRRTKVITLAVVAVLGSVAVYVWRTYDIPSLLVTERAADERVLPSTGYIVLSLAKEGEALEWDLYQYDVAEGDLFYLLTPPEGTQLAEARYDSQKSGIAFVDMPTTEIGVSQISIFGFAADVLIPVTDNEAVAKRDINWATPTDDIIVYNALTGTRDGELPASSWIVAAVSETDEWTLVEGMSPVVTGETKEDIFFLGNDGLYKTTLGGEEVISISPSPYGGVTFPDSIAMSFDGNQIAWLDVVEEGEGTLYLYTLNEEQTEATLIREVETFAEDVVFSPDGTELALKVAVQSNTDENDWADAIYLYSIADDTTEILDIFDDFAFGTLSISQWVW